MSITSPDCSPAVSYWILNGSVEPNPSSTPAYVRLAMRMRDSQIDISVFSYINRFGKRRMSPARALKLTVHGVPCPASAMSSPSDRIENTEPSKLKIKKEGSQMALLLEDAQELVEKLTDFLTKP